LGLLGLLIWPGATATTRVERRVWSIERVIWPVLTLFFAGLLIAVYPRTASLGSGNSLATLEVSLAAWLLASGGIVTRQVVRSMLLAIGILSALLALWLLIAARA
jgi:hypothetical protein